MLPHVNSQDLDEMNAWRRIYVSDCVTNRWTEVLFMYWRVKNDTIFFSCLLIYNDCNASNWINIFRTVIVIFFLGIFWHQRASLKTSLNLVHTIWCNTMIMIILCRYTQHKNRQNYCFCTDTNVFSIELQPAVTGVYSMSACVLLLWKQTLFRSVRLCCNRSVSYFQAIF